MKRIDTATKAVDLFGAGKHGFKDGNLGLGVLPTDFDASICNNLQEEPANLVEAAGIALDGNVRTQLAQAIKRIAGANVTTVTFAMSPFALTADHAGLVLINAAAGNVVLNLPLANVVAGLPLPYEFERIDATANTATTNAAGANLIDGAASFTLAGQWASRCIRGDAVSAWATTATSTVLAASTAEAQAQTDNTKVITPLRLAQALQGANQSLTANGYQRLPGGLILQWGITAAVGATGTVATTFPITFPTACRSVVVGRTGAAVAAQRADLISAFSASGFSVNNGSADASAQFLYQAFGN